MPRFDSSTRSLQISRSWSSCVSVVRSGWSTVWPPTSFPASDSALTCSGVMYWLAPHAPLMMKNVPFIPCAASTSFVWNWSAYPSSNSRLTTVCAADAVGTSANRTTTTSARTLPRTNFSNLTLSPTPRGQILACLDSRAAAASASFQKDPDWRPPSTTQAGWPHPTRGASNRSRTDQRTIRAMGGNHTVFTAAAAAALLVGVGSGGAATPSTAGCPAGLGQVAFSGPDGSLRVARLGTCTVQLLVRRGLARGPSASADGRLLAYAVYGIDATGKVGLAVRVTPLGGDFTRTLLAKHTSGEFSWAPRGHTLAVTTLEGGLELVDADTGAARRGLPDGSGAGGAQFSPDGRRLVGEGARDPWLGGAGPRTRTPPPGARPGG